MSTIEIQRKLFLLWIHLNTHNKSCVYETFSPKEAKRIVDKLEIHFTSKYGSWLNMAEIESSHLSRQCLNRRIESRNLLAKAIEAWNNERNKMKVKTDWRFTTQDARIKLKKLYPAL